MKIIYLKIILIKSIKKTQSAQSSKQHSDKYINGFFPYWYMNKISKKGITMLWKNETTSANEICTTEKKKYNLIY